MEGQTTSTTTSVENGPDQARTTETQTRTTNRTSLYGAPSRIVRTNWIYYLRASWQRISRTSKFILGTTILIGAAQIVITIVMLIIGKNEQCDRPLDIYLIVFLIRLSFSLPLLIYQHLRPLHSDGGNISSTATMAAATVAAATARSSRTTATPAAAAAAAAAAANTSPRSNTPTFTDSTATSTTNTQSPSSSSSSSNNVSVTSVSREETATQPHPTDRTTQTHPSSSRLTIPTRNCLDRTKSFLDLISILWFVVGNYLIFTAPDQCHRDARHLFYTTLAWILLGYFLVLIPLLLCATVVFCLPCLLVTMRTMNVDYATGMVGANKDEIQAIPVYKYRNSTNGTTTTITTLDDALEQQNPQQHPEQQSTSISPHEAISLPASSSTSPDVSPTTITEARKKKKSVLRRLFSISPRNKNALHEEETAAGFAEWTMDDPNDAVCTICLSDYEDGDLVCKLRCNHHFHRDCVHEWLALNFKCPLCQRDFRGEKTENDDDHPC